MQQKPNSIEELLSSLRPSKTLKFLDVEPLVDRIYCARNQAANLCIVFVIDELTYDRTIAFHGFDLLTRSRLKIRKTVTSDISACIIEIRHLDRLRQLALLHDIRRRRNRDKLALSRSSDILSYLEEWGELFAQTGLLTKEREIGVWGELNVLNSLPSDALWSWVGPLGRLHDFETKKLHLEVKTAKGTDTHHFSLEQVQSGPGVTLYIISQLLREDMAGRDLHDLVKEARSRFSKTDNLNELLARVGYVEDGQYSRFNCFSQRWFIGESIPKPINNSDRVSNIEFLCDLTRAPSTSTKRVAKILDSFPKN